MSLMVFTLGWTFVMINYYNFWAACANLQSSVINSELYLITYNGLKKHLSTYFLLRLK